MNGNRLYRDPNEWKNGDTITEARLNKLEIALLTVAQEVINAAGIDNNHQEITLNERLDLLREKFSTDIS